MAEAIKEFNVQMGEATQLREEEKAKNKATILDAQDEADPTALVQSPRCRKTTAS